MNVKYDPRWFMNSTTEGIAVLIGTRSGENAHVVSGFPLNTSETPGPKYLRTIESSLPGGLEILGLSWASSLITTTRNLLVSIISQVHGCLLLEWGVSRVFWYSVTGGICKIVEPIAAEVFLTHHIVRLPVRAVLERSQFPTQIERWFLDSVKLRSHRLLDSVHGLRLILWNGTVRLCNWYKTSSPVDPVQVNAYIVLVSITTSVTDFKIPNFVPSLNRQLSQGIINPSFSLVRISELESVICTGMPAGCGIGVTGVSHPDLPFLAHKSDQCILPFTGRSFVIGCTVLAVLIALAISNST